MDFIATLKELGFDTDAALGYCAKDKDFYAEMLQDFADDHNTKAASLNRFYDERDWKNYETLIHSLKSTAKTVGASRLSEAARLLEEAAEEADENYLSGHHAACMELYQKTIDEILSCL